MEMNLRYFKNKYLNFIFTSDAVEAFMFSVLCATVFTAGMCHWILDVGYKYIAAEPSLGKVDFNWVFVVCAVVSTYYLIRKRTVQFDFALVVLCQTFVLVGVMDYHSERYDVVPYAWILPMAYIVGKVAVGNDAKTANYRIEKLYFALASGMLITALLDFMTVYEYTDYFYFRQYRTGVWPSFWLGGIWENRLTYEFGFILITAAVGYLFYCAKRNIFTLVVAIQLNLYIQLLVSDIGGRTTRLQLPISLLVFLFIYIFHNWKTFPVSVKQVIKIVIIFILLAFFAIMVAYLKNISDVRDKYLNSVWAADGGILRNVRFLMDYAGFNAMLEHPLEDYEIVYGLEKTHSMILEYGRVYGFTIWLLVVAFRLIVIKDVILLIFKKNDYSWIKYLLIPSFVAVNLYYSMEPNGYAHKHLWAVGLLLSGMIRGCLCNAHRRKGI